ncbi:AmpG family muropeptide MFS transporter [Aestuariispira insulae]|nr:MFS transporter [Aestuariispira insulae]
MTEDVRRSWGESLRAFFHPRVITMLFLGFSAGIPILLVFSTLSVWLREAGVERAAIGFFSWAALGYGFKFVWAPIIDKMPLPLITALMGQRRSWLLLSQLSVIAALALMAMIDPVENLVGMAVAAVALGFASATQDIVIDAYRIDSADEDLQGMMSATYIAGYRIGMLVAGAGALELAGMIDVIEGYDYGAWQITYFSMAAVMVAGIITTFLIPEPNRPDGKSAHLNSLLDYLQFLGLFIAVAFAFAMTFFLSSDLANLVRSVLVETGMAESLAGFLIGTGRLVTAVSAAALLAVLLTKTHLVPREMVRETYVAPFADFFDRFGRIAMVILFLIATYRIADVVMGVMANVFYVDLGFEKQEIGRISKGFGLAMTLAGGFLGGLLIMRFGVMRILFLGGILAAGTNILFAVMAGLGNQLWMLMVVISADNLSAGIASAAFVAYLSSLTSKSFTATQYALFSSMMLLLPKLIAGYSGVAVEALGYASFFIGTAFLGIVPLALILYLGFRKPRLSQAT